MDKREYIKKYIDDIKNEESVNFIYYFMQAHLNKVWVRDNLRKQK